MCTYAGLIYLWYYIRIFPLLSFILVVTVQDSTLSQVGDIS